MSFPAAPWLHRLLPALGRRLVVVDPGRRFIKVLVVDQGVRHPRVVHFQTLSAPAASTAPADEMDAQLESLLGSVGPHERVLVLPQYRAIAQVVETPAGSPAETQAALLREARRLSGLEESALTFDVGHLRPFGRFQDPSWLTLCKREELDSLVARFATAPSGAPPGTEPPLLAEVTTSGQALFAAAAVLGSAGRSAVLVDLRANNSVIAIVVNGQGVTTTTIPTGSLQLQETLPDETAAVVATPGQARGSGTPAGGEAPVEPGDAALRKWSGEIRLAVAEWIEDNPECGLALPDLPVFLCGVGATRPGLVELLNTLSPLRFVAWEQRVTAGRPWPMADYLVPFGAALLALEHRRHGASLLPADDRTARRRRRALAWLQSLNVLLVLFLMGLLSFSLWQKYDLIQRKQQITQRAQAALQTALAIDRTYLQLARGYSEVHPILERQRQTLEALQSLAAVRAARTNDDFWYVLFADAASYATGRTGVPITTTSGAAHRPATTNAPVSPAREYIVEVCVPHEGERQRRILSDLVADLKRDVLFRRVDALPPERNRDWLPTNVYVSNRVFALAMEIAGNELPAPAPLLIPPGPAREAGRAAPRPELAVPPNR